MNKIDRQYMKYKIGEFVRFVDERREGYITTIFNDELIGVTGDDDFEIPVPANKVTYVHGHSNENNKENKAASVSSPHLFNSKGIHIAAISDPRQGSLLNFHLVNETSYQLMITLISKKNEEEQGQFAGMVNPSSAVKIHTGSLPDINQWPQLQLTILYFTTLTKKHPEPLIIKLNYKAKDFSGSKRKTPVLNQDGWIQRLDEDDIIIDPVKLKESFFKPKEEMKAIEKPLSEIDLHIEKLREDYKSLSKTEILKIQLDQFKKALDAAIVHKLPSIIFIHGIGNGVLRMEIHKALGRNAHVKTFMDARKEKFGYGATEAILK